jgi:anti-sigma regulatory factor (Ser/Thr protein kinase)
VSSQLHLLEERSQVGSTRRAASELAISLGFSSVDSGKIALAITEIGTNILKHAGTGRMVLRALEQNGIPGLEILGLDSGPGMANVAASLQDGRSTAGSAGHGLGALARLSPAFEVYSQPGRGTAVRLEFWTRSPGRAAHELGAVCVAKSGETVSGDAWIVRCESGWATLLVTDGLGHGPEAARASRAATRVLIEHPDWTASRLLEECHAALAPTRGAAMAAARVDASGRGGTFAGVGNISARVLDGIAQRSLTSHNGTVGHNMRRLQEFAFPFNHGSLLIMHSDGMGTHWQLADYPGLAVRHPGLIAGVLYRDHDRGRDDVTVVVMRASEPQAVGA